MGACVFSAANLPAEVHCRDYWGAGPTFTPDDCTNNGGTYMPGTSCLTLDPSFTGACGFTGLVSVQGSPTCVLSWYPCASCEKCAVGMTTCVGAPGSSSSSSG